MEYITEGTHTIGGVLYSSFSVMSSFLFSESVFFFVSALPAEYKSVWMMRGGFVLAFDPSGCILTSAGYADWMSYGVRSVIRYSFVLNCRRKLAACIPAPEIR